MQQVRGFGWGEDESTPQRPGRILMMLALVVALVAAAAPVGAVETHTQGEGATSWIVQAATGATGQAIDLVGDLGGEVVLPLPIIDGFSARLTPAQVDRLQGDPSVRALTPDVSIQLASRAWSADRGERGAGAPDWVSGPPADEGSLHVITDRVLGATDLWRRGITGDGIDVALIDTGIAPVPGLNGPAKVVHGPDLSLDAGADNLRYLDLYGHGTHLASIIAGNDLQGDRPPDTRDLRTAYLGVAPEARIVNVKVADGAGRADLSQVIAAINWVVEHQDSGELDIRVLALAFGTDGSQDYRLDPLAHAVETAWHNGLVVVTAAGNDGNARSLRNPAIDPYVVAVGAVSTNGTRPSGDDRVLPFSNCGTSERGVDLLAPGKSILGLRVPNSYIDNAYPSAVEHDRLFRGSGTSQAVAVTAGAVALLLDQRPGLTPDQVKALLVDTAGRVRSASGACAGAGTIDLVAAARAATPADANQTWPSSAGLGSIEAARGSHHLANPDGSILTGEVDVFGVAWDAEPWAAETTALTTWDGGVWNDTVWAGDGWVSNSWSSNSWSSNSWSSNSWSSNSWSSNSWSSNSWSSNSWSTAEWVWSSNSWSSNSWSSNSWSSNSWSSNSWSGTVWATDGWR